MLKPRESIEKFYIVIVGVHYLTINDGKAGLTLDLKEAQKWIAMEFTLHEKAIPAAESVGGKVHLMTTTTQTTFSEPEGEEKPL